MSRAKKKEPELTSSFLNEPLKGYKSKHDYSKIPLPKWWNPAFKKEESKSRLFTHEDFIRIQRESQIPKDNEEVNLFA